MDRFAAALEWTVILIRRFRRWIGVEPLQDGSDAHNSVQCFRSAIAASLFAMLGLISSVVHADLIPNYYSAPGLDPNRDYLNQHHSEHIDPFTGKLQLHYVDLVLAGQGGFDLKLQRSYTNIEYTQRETTDATLLGARRPLGHGMDNALRASA